MNFLAGFGVLLFIFQFAHVAFSADCSGYVINLRTLENGATNNAVIEPDAAVTLSSDCKLTIKGCITISNPFNVAKIKYKTTVQNANFIIQGCMAGIPYLNSKGSDGDDVCAFLRDVMGCEELDYCPVKEKDTRICSSDIAGAESIDLSNYVQFFEMILNKDIEIKDAKVKYDTLKALDKFTIKIRLEKKTSSCV